MNKRPHILYLSNLYPRTINGVTTVVNNILTGLKEDFDLGIICPNTSAHFAKTYIDDIPHYLLPSYRNPIRKDVRIITPNPFQLQKAFDDFEPDLIHLHDPSPASIVLKEIAISNNIPVVISHHFTPQLILGYLPDYIKDYAQQNDNIGNAILKLTCRLYEGSQYLIVPTKTVKKSFTNLTNIPIGVISSGIDLERFQDNSNIDADLYKKYKLPDSPFVLYVGRLDPDKNIPLMLQAWKDVLQTLPTCKLVLVGTGSIVGKLKKICRDLEIEASVVWSGLAPESDLPDIYLNPNAKAFVITSPIESQSIVTLMAIASQLPVVAADSGALPEIVKNNINGYLCDPDSAQDFSTHILRLLKNPTSANKMGQSGSKIISNHSLKKVLPKYAKIYHQLLFDHNSNA